MSQFPSSGIPGVGANALTLAYRTMFTTDTGPGDFVPGGRLLDGAATRDPGSSRSDECRAGLVLGKITATALLAAAIIGTSINALASTGTTVTLSAAEATELVRRQGATGTFTLTGPPAAAGVVRTLTATYSAVNTTTGAVTITALGVDEVQTITPTGTASAGTFSVQILRPTGIWGSTGPVAYNASIATIQTALDLASGVANGVVASSAASAAPFSTPTPLILTYSGTGFAKLPQTLARFDNSGLTGNTVAAVSVTTAGVDGRMAAGAFAGPTDGSQVPVTFLVGPTPIRVTDVTDASIAVVQVPLIPMTSKPVNVVNVIGYPTDTSLIAYLKSKLRVAVPGMTFSDDL